MSVNGGQKYRYSLVIQWSEEDKAYIASVPELPGCQARGATREEAVKQVSTTITEWIETAKAKGHSIPSPRTFTYWSPFRDSTEIDAAQSAPAKG